MQDTMDEIEAGFTQLVQRISEREGRTDELAGEILHKESVLFGRMAAIAAPVVKQAGLSLLRRGKQDTRVELYDSSFYQEKMIVLGKTDPAPHRPDDPAKSVTDQFCVLSETGALYELMYSSDGFIVDSYLNALSPEESVRLYTNEILLMLYRALRDYLKGQEELLEALEKTLSFMHGSTAVMSEKREER